MRIAAVIASLIILAASAAPAQAALPSDAEAILAVIMEHSNTVEVLAKDPNSEPNQSFRDRSEAIATCLSKVTESPEFTAKPAVYKKKFKKSVAFIREIDDAGAPIMAYSPLIEQTEQKLLALPLNISAYKNTAKAGAKLLSLWRQRDAIPEDGQWLTCRYARQLSKAKKISVAAELKAQAASRVRSPKQERALIKEMAKTKKVLKKGRRQLVKDGASEEQEAVLSSFFNIDGSP